MAAAACLLSFVILVSGSTGDRPALRLVAPRAQLAQGQGASWLSTLTEAPAWAQHDYANLVLLPLLSGLTLAALRTERAHLPLATLLLAYMALDALWMVAQPSVVKALQLLKAPSRQWLATPSLLEPLSDLERSAWAVRIPMTGCGAHVSPSQRRRLCRAQHLGACGAAVAPRGLGRPHPAHGALALPPAPTPTPTLTLSSTPTPVPNQVVHPPHRRYVAWMSVVELNTFFLVLRRHLRRRWVEVCFAGRGVDT